jgi:hypothetical protein
LEPVPSREISIALFVSPEEVTHFTDSLAKALSGPFVRVTVEPQDGSASHYEDVLSLKGESASTPGGMAVTAVPVKDFAILRWTKDSWTITAFSKGIDLPTLLRFVDGVTIEG